MRYWIIIVLALPAVAEWRQEKPPDPKVEVDVVVEQPVIEIGAPKIDIDAPTDVKVETPVHVETPIEINDAGVTLNQRTSVPRQVPDSTLFFSSPNVEQCARYLGGAVATKEGTFMLGIPMPFRPRSVVCDLWLAANEAQENGHILLSYAFQCEIKAIRTRLGEARCEKIQKAVDRWFDNYLEIDSDTGEFRTADVADTSVLEQQLGHIQQVVLAQGEQLSTVQQQLEAEQARRNRSAQAAARQRQELDTQLDTWLQGIESRSKNDG